MRDFVRELIKKGIVEINPYLDIGGIRYPEAEGYAKDQKYSTMMKTLTRLVDENILKEKESTHVISFARSHDAGAIFAYQGYWVRLLWQS